MALPCWRTLLVALALAPAMQVTAATLVRMPRPESILDERTNFAFRVLDHALKRSGRSYRVEQHPLRMLQGRALLRLQTNQGIDVVCTMTSARREALARPIRIPLDKGLLSWRFLLIDQARAARFADIRRLGDLDGLLAGQGSDWPDMAILRANGLQVYGTSNYASLFDMLATGRIDYFPRGLTEVWTEQSHYGNRFSVVPGVVLRYPGALYFFVRKGNTRLANDITRGLERMIADGTFEQMFLRQYGDMIRKSALRERRVIDLVNPVVPNHLPLERKNLWFRE